MMTGHKKISLYIKGSLAITGWIVHLQLTMYATEFLMHSSIFMNMFLLKTMLKLM